MIGQTISQYKILEKLGEGGMGIVYKAQDLKLERPVALKFLPEHLSASATDQARLLQEAKAAAALNHPNVCSIIDIHESEGRRFLVMEYVDGKTLREAVAGSGISTQVAIDYAIQIGEALQAAHERGVVHRDIKSENIMVAAGGRIKVMDFGLARLRGAAQLTRTSSTVGTLAYMAPEQIEGRDADARSDIFSFGVVCFEMLTGRLPFQGEHEAAVMYSIVNQEPESILVSHPDASPELDRILRRAMEKDPGDRYQSVADMVSELRRLKRQTGKIATSESVHRASAGIPRAEEKSMPRRKRWIGAAAALLVVMVAAFVVFRTHLLPGGASLSEKKMLVVLPFENLGSPDQEYFADGITEEITSKLSGLSGIGVIARSSAMQYKKTTKSLKQIGQELGVAYILQGTIRWETTAGVTRVRVNPQLIQVGDETQIWSQPSEAVLAGAFKLQSDIATQVASALNITLLTQERQTLESKPTENAEAYDFYLRGNEYAFRSVTEQDIRLSIQMYQRAVALDPKFAAAYARLGEVHANMYWEYYDRSNERLQEARSAAERAVQLGPTLPDAHAAMGWYYYHGLREYENALKEFTLSLRGQPNNSDVMLGIGSVYRRQGNFEEALTQIQHAADINPRWSALSDEVAATYYLLRRYAEAERAYDHSLAIAPEVSIPYQEKAWMLIVWKGDVDGAQQLLRDAVERKVGSDDPSFVLTAARIEILRGSYKNALDLIESSRYDVFAQQFWYIPKDLVIAEIYGYMRQSDQVRRRLNAARTVLEKEIQVHPDDGRVHSALGIVYASLGKKEEAVREGKKGLDLLPLAKDAMIAPNRMTDLAEIYTILGESDAAIDMLQQLLTIPSAVSVPLLKLDPTWIPLRGQPRFQALLKGKGE